MILRERPSPSTPDQAPETPGLPRRVRPGRTTTRDAILRIHRNDLKPDVRAYADNLRDQVRKIWRDHGVATIDEFESAARTKNISLEKVREVHMLLERLHEVVEKGMVREFVAMGEQFLAQAKDIATTIKDQSDRDHAYGNIVEAEAGVHRFQEARATAERIITDSTREYALKSVATEAAKIGSFDIAEEVLSHIHDKNIHEATLCTIVAAELLQGQQDRLRIHIPMMTNDKTRTHVERVIPYMPKIKTGMSIEYFAGFLNHPQQDIFFRDLAIRLAEGGSFDDAKTIHREIQNGHQWDLATEGCVAAAVRQGQFARAEEIITFFRPGNENKIRVSVHAHRAAAEARRGEDALATFAEVKAIARSMSLDDGRIAAWLTIAEQEIVAGFDSAGSLTAARQALMEGPSRSDEERIGHWHSIARVVHLAGRDPAPTLAHAIKRAQEYYTEKDFSRYMYSLAKDEASWGLYAHARETARACPYLDDTVVALVKIAEAEYAAQHDPEATLMEAKKYAAQCGDYLGTACYARIAAAESACGKDPTKTFMRARELMVESDEISVGTVASAMASAAARLIQRGNG